MTKPPSALTRTRISGVLAKRADEPEIDPESFGEFSYFCCKVLKPGGNAVGLAHFFMIANWILNLYEAGFIVVPYTKAFLFNGSIVPKRYIAGFPKTFLQYAPLTRILVHSQNGRAKF